MIRDEFRKIKEELERIFEELEEARYVKFKNVI